LRVARVESGGGQRVLVGQALPQDVVFKVTDANQLPFTHFAVTLSASPGVAFFPPGGTTDDDGTFTASVRAGTHLGTNTLTLSGEDTAPATAAITVDEVDPGDIITVLDALRLYAIVPPTGPIAAITSKLHEPMHAVADASGGFYVDDLDYCSVFHVDGDGVLERIAGTGTCGPGDGDGGQATEATLGRPIELAFDASLGVLYIADPGDNRVRAVDLASGIIT
jgi:hypothetical protein